MANFPWKHLEGYPCGSKVKSLGNTLRGSDRPVDNMIRDILVFCNLANDCIDFSILAEVNLRYNEIKALEVMPRNVTYVGDIFDALSRCCTSKSRWR